MRVIAQIDLWPGTYLFSNQLYTVGRSVRGLFSANFEFIIQLAAFEMDLKNFFS